MNGVHNNSLRHKLIEGDEEKLLKIFEAKAKEENEKVLEILEELIG